VNERIMCLVTSVHMRLKQVEVLSRNILSGIKCSVWKEAYQHRSLLLDGMWITIPVTNRASFCFTLDSLSFHTLRWYKCRWVWWSSWRIWLWREKCSSGRLVKQEQWERSPPSSLHPFPPVPLEVGPEIQLGVWGTVIYPAGVWGGAPAEIEFGAF